MLQFEEYFKIAELLISVISVILVIIGLILPFRQSLRLNKENYKDELNQKKMIWRIQLIDEQISKYYGPICAILKEQTIIRKRIWYQIGRQVIFDERKDD